MTEKRKHVKRNINKSLKKNKCLILSFYHDFWYSNVMLNLISTLLLSIMSELC